MSGLREAVSDFLDGFGPGAMFIGTRRGAPTEIFATDEVPCDPEIQAYADRCIIENAKHAILAHHWLDQDELPLSVIHAIKQANLDIPEEVTKAARSIRENESLRSVIIEWIAEGNRANDAEHELPSR